MAGVSDLDALLASLEPQLDDVTLVYALAPSDSDVRRRLAGVAIARIEEHEGTTLVLPIDVARHHRLRYEFACRRLTLRVHSALDAVGLTAAVATALAVEGVPANMLAGFHHDHVLVPVDDAEAARDVLVDLTRPPTVRAATRADEALLRQMARYADPATPEQGPRSDPDVYRLVEQWGRDGDHGVVAVGASGRLVGAAWCRRPDGDDEHTPAVAVTPSQRGRGVARALLAALLHVARQAGVDRLARSLAVRLESDQADALDTPR